MDMYCPGFIANATGQKCTPHVLVGTPQRCPACGGTATLAPGTVLNSGTDTYTLTEVLGIGGMGIVYKAADSTSNDVVVKQLYVDDPAALPDAQRRFRREAQIQAGLNNPALPRGFGSFVDPAIAAVNPDAEFMAMEFVPGQDLEKVLATRPGGMMDEIEVLQLGIQVCDGLVALHNFADPATGQPDPIQHRDLKPANIILRPSGQICILDLGIARTVRRLQATQAAGGGPRATMAGTFEYASPQQITGTNMSIRDDIYSLAATLFHLKMATPFAGHYLADPTKGVIARATEIDQLPANWRACFRRAIHNDTNLRQRSADEFKNDLVGLLPAHLQPAAAGPAAIPAPIAAPAAPLPVAIRWRVNRAYMVNPNEWRQPVGGQIVQGGIALPGLNITPIMTDTGPGAMANNTTGTVVTSGLHGDFGLDIPDVTVPATVDQREIVIVVEDPNTGVELYRETIELDRPGVAQRVRARGAAGVGAVAHPFVAAGHGIAGAARAGRQRLGAGAQHARGALAWPFHQAARGGRAARRALGAFVAAASSWQLLVGVAILLLLATFVGAALQKRWDWFLYIWPHLFVATVVLSYFGWKLRTKTFRQALKSAYLINFLVIVWTLGWLGYILR